MGSLGLQEKIFKVRIPTVDVSDVTGWEKRRFKVKNFFWICFIEWSLMMDMECCKGIQGLLQILSGLWFILNQDSFSRRGEFSF